MTLEMSPEQIQESKIYREWGLTDEEYLKIKDEILDGRLPNFTETGMYAVMWSEHCCYKNSKPVLKKFPTTGPQVLMGPGEGAGVVDIGDDLAVVFKAESHNHPSYVEPYEGAATGSGGKNIRSNRNATCIFSTLKAFSALNSIISNYKFTDRFVF